MRDAQPTTIYLKNYQAPAYAIRQTDLVVRIFTDFTEVEANLTIERTAKSATPLVLDGENLDTKWIKLDGVELQADQFTISATELSIASVPASFQLTTLVRIDPKGNTSLQGLYESNGMYCTQCEAEGFRGITWFADRPDVMSRFTTRIEADLAAFPVLLSNGNPIDQGKLADGRHFATWEDPHLKPSYLFALVAGDLEHKEDHFTTMHGRQVTLRIFVESHNLHKVDFAMGALQRSMQWDEQRFGREYDLDLFMIVAVDHFNMGAMENKGLNIFNSALVLADSQTATDAAFERIEAVVGHEYFHNWSGNRVTCRDWFQLSLKEGFTVYRDCEFTSDLHARGVKRIEDVNVLRTHQFAEDAGPMAHPIRPSSYIEINNFYTLTVYEKGAEVVRMIATLLGEECFRQGSDLYFSRFDGQAVTTEDFVTCMEEVSGLDLTQFKRWYEQAGTPVVEVVEHYDADQQVYRLSFKQSCPPTPGQSEKLPFHIPIRFGLLDPQGLEIKDLQCTDPAFQLDHSLINLTQAEQVIEFTGIGQKPIASLLRDFSAPIKLEFQQSDEDIALLAAHDSNDFNRWESVQTLYVRILKALYESENAEDVAAVVFGDSLVSTLGLVLADQALDSKVKAEILTLPSVKYLSELIPQTDILLLQECRERAESFIATHFEQTWLQIYSDQGSTDSYVFEHKEVARRRLRNLALYYLTLANEEMHLAKAEQQYNTANNLTDRKAALAVLLHAKHFEGRKALLEAFYEQWQHDGQMIEQWLQLQSTAEGVSVPDIRELMSHPAFEWKNPNRVRSLIGGFSQNTKAFHAEDGSGYEFVKEQILYLNKRNPQIASRLCAPLTQWRKYNDRSAQQMKTVLMELNANELSRDLYEVVSKSLL